jgi:predicted HicB family RNase H-like nuclease
MTYTNDYRDGIIAVRHALVENISLNQFVEKTIAEKVNLSEK